MCAIQCDQCFIGSNFKVLQIFLVESSKNIHPLTWGYRFSSSSWINYRWVLRFEMQQLLFVNAPLKKLMKFIKLENIENYIREKGCKHLFILISIQLIFLIASCITFIALEYQTDENSYKNEDLYKWLILLLFSLSQFYYAWHSVNFYLRFQIIKKNMLELLAYLIISTCTTIASTLRYFYISTDDELNHKIVHHIFIELVQIVCYIYILFSIVV